MIHPRLVLQLMPLHLFHLNAVLQVLSIILTRSVVQTKLQTSPASEIISASFFVPTGQISRISGPALSVLNFGFPFS